MALTKILLYDIDPEDESMGLANLPPDIPLAFTKYLKKCNFKKELQNKYKRHKTFRP